MTPYTVQPVVDLAGKPQYYGVEGPGGKMIIRFVAVDVAEWCRDLFNDAYAAGLAAPRPKVAGKRSGQ